MNNNSYPTYDIELSLVDKNYKYIAGVDEVGRGCLAYSVVAAAVIVPLDKISIFIGKVKDSKKLSPKRRDVLYESITNNCIYGIGSSSSEIIDNFNIYEATKLAMKEAIKCLPQVDYALIDGNMTLDGINIPQMPIIKGDNISLSVACASIIAKVVRDRLITEIHKEFPVYDFINNKGYGTAKHIAALKKYGPCKYHRFTFNKVL